MEKLDWGKRLVFSNVREYYETLGFLCKEKEVIKVYIEVVLCQDLVQIKMRSSAS